MHALTIAILLSLLSGCAVTQPRGLGTERHLRSDGEPYVYWLYMPPDREPGEKLPIVVSLHGLKPFDSAKSQCREWQQQADSHRFAVVAPELRSPNLLSPMPLDKVTRDLERDGRAVAGILASLSRRDWFDPDAVMITSWSYGGYIAHWVANRYPKLFTCLAVRQSNFNDSILDPSKLHEYRYREIGIFSTSNDFKMCRSESKRAAEWYARRGFDVTFSTIDGRGHDRTPGPAASFFSRSIQSQTSDVSQPPPLTPTKNDFSEFRFGEATQQDRDILSGVDDLGASPADDLLNDAQSSLAPECDDPEADVQNEADMLARSDPEAFLEFCLRLVEGLIWDYSATFTKCEKIGNKMRKEQKIAIRFKRVPFSVHMTWLQNPGKAKRILYVKGARVGPGGEEMLLVEPSGTLVRLIVSNVERPIRSPEARRESRKPVDQFGFVNTLRLALKYARPVHDSLEFVGDAEFGGRPVWHVRRTLPTRWPDYTLDLMIDKEMLVPLSAVSKDRDGKLLSRYEFSDIVLNVNYRSEDFEGLGPA